MRLLSRLRPREFVASIYEIDWRELYRRGMRAVLTDLDNTLVEWNSPVATPQLLTWLNEVRTLGFEVCIVSNNDAKRVLEFAERVGIPAIYKAGKPRRRSYLKAMRMLGVEPSATVMVGDQIFTDVLGANRLGLYTILVKPIHPREFVGTRLMRRMERLILRQLPSPAVAADTEDRNER